MLLVRITKKAMSFLAYWTGRHDDFLLLSQRLYQLSITNSVKHSSYDPGHVKDLTSLVTGDVNT